MSRFFDPRSPRAVATGRANKAAGSTFEYWLDLQHAQAKREGLLAHVEKNEPHSKIAGGRVIYSAAGVSDYTGTLAAGTRETNLFTSRASVSPLDGVTLAAEAKSTSAARLARAEVKPRQVAHLDAVARAGGLALLLVEFRNFPHIAGGVRHEQTRFAIPWLSVPWKKLRTADSVGPEDLMEAANFKWVIVDGESYLSRFVTKI